MADFNHGDIVVSKNSSGKLIEAEVDFQQGSQLYISEWGKSLKCPIRYVINAEHVCKKEGRKIKISLFEMNDLMWKVLGLKGQDYNHEPNFENMTEGQEFVHGSHTYRYVGRMEGEPIREMDGYFCTIDSNDLSKLIWTQDNVCKSIFGVGKEDIEVY